ncbi:MULTISPECIES: dihydroorotase [unclassified Gemella]|uniref:dihydroorotase n=1 Tax=unclassified Gemella TaxID=2624949 RepID=UPI001073D095|nr:MULTISPECIES: dihydroorotase [unclassified Gemella]MBF0710432.1 dihydroorotase [Gemella sp. GL1.1]MBF0747070.1 dihydroorotase [Gemella sp. 19428wG2_WT2a]NYS27776.1 dihydroorotase [Gemella sp. GL1]TFU58561.1 dihydroorotase [Gemella sp. WT2a]
MLLLKNGKILENGKLIKKDILVEGKYIKSIKDEIELEGAEVLELNGKFVSPGFIDVHVHWREPGFEYKESIYNASRAAARGGFTTAMPMPNLDPVPDTYENLKLQLDIIEKDSVIRAIPYGAITKGELGEEYAEFEELSEHVFAFSDDGRGVQDANMMYQSMKIASKLNKAIVAHCEDNSLILGGCMHCGKRSDELGQKGIPSVCESVQIARDVLLAEDAACHYHVCHVSTKESVRIIRDAKKTGIKVTCEVCPHHLISDENDITEAIGMWKMNPPLRASEDRQALIAGVLDGTIDIIATDHAPHALHEKEVPMAESAFGIVGSETAFGQLYTNFVKTNIFTLEQIVNMMSTRVGEIFDLPYGKLAEGELADLTVIDLERKEVINPDNFLSKGRNTPYKGQEIYGIPELTLVEGKVAYKDERIF